MNGYSETRSREEGAVKIAPQAASLTPTASSNSLDTDAIIAKVDFNFLTIPCFFIFFPHLLYQIEFLSFSSPRCWPPSDRPFRPQSASLSRGDEILQSPQCFQEIYLKFSIYRKNRSRIRGIDLPFEYIVEKQLSI